MELQHLKEEKERAAFEITELKGRESILINRLKEWSDKYNEQVKEIEKLKSLVSQKNEEILSKEYQLKEQQKKLDQTRDKNLDQLITEQNNTQRLHQLVSEMRKKQDTLVLQAKRAEELDVTIQMQEESINGIIEEKLRLEKKLKDSKAYIQQLRQETLTIKSESNKKASNLEEELKATDEKHQSELSKIKEEYESRIQDLEAENADLRSQNNILRKRVEECLNNINSTKTELITSQKRLKDIENKNNQDIQRLIREKESEAANYKFQLEKIQRLESEKDETIELYQKQITSLRSQLLKQSETEKKLDMTKASLISAKNEKDDLSKVLIEKNHMITELKEKISNLNARLKEEKKLFKEERHFLKSQIQEQFQSAQINAYSEVMQSVKESDEKNKQILRDVFRKETLLKEYKIKVVALEAKIEELDTTNTELKNRLKEQQRKEASVKDIQLTNSRLLESIKKLENEISAANKNIEEKTNQIKSHKLRIERMTKDESLLKLKSSESIKKLEEDMSLLNKTIEEKNMQIKTYKNKLEKLDTLVKLISIVATQQLSRVHQLAQELIQHKNLYAEEMKQVEEEYSSTINLKEQDISLSLLGLSYNEFKDIMDCTKLPAKEEITPQEKLKLIEQLAFEKHQQVQEALTSKQFSAVSELLEQLIIQRVQIELLLK